MCAATPEPLSATLALRLCVFVCVHAQWHTRSSSGPRVQYRLRCGLRAPFPLTRLLRLGLHTHTRNRTPLRTTVANRTPENRSPEPESRNLQTRDSPASRNPYNRKTHTFVFNLRKLYGDNKHNTKNNSAATASHRR